MLVDDWTLGVYDPWERGEKAVALPPAPIHLPGWLAIVVALGAGFVFGEM